MTGVIREKQEGDVRHSYKGEGHMKMEAKIGVMQPQTKNTWSHQKLQESRKDPPLEPWEGVWPWDTLILDLWLLEPRETKFLF